MSLSHIPEAKKQALISEEIERLKDEPRSIAWIEYWITETVCYEPECLDAILAELEEGGLREQLRALRGHNLVQIQNTEQIVNKSIERMIMRIVLKSENLIFLERARKAGWIKWSAAFSVSTVIRLNKWLNIKHERIQTA